MIGFHDADKTNFPNIALMKLSAACKLVGKDTELYRDGVVYEKVFSSKVFTFTEDTAPEGAELGGYARNSRVLPESVEHMCPDYSLYGIDYSMGFLTRGCPNKCSWCFVPDKEGDIRPNADFSEFVRHKEAVFMDNNVLAHDHGIEQIEKLGVAGVKVDFNQGLDPRRIDDSVAKRLGKLKYMNPLRLACDSDSAIEPVRKAVELLRWYNVTPRAYFCYVLVKDVDSALDRVKFLKGIGVDPFAQPFISLDGTPPSRELRQFARWVNLKQLFKSVSWEDYQAERGDRI
jgi:hypothetical protein